MLSRYCNILLLLGDNMIINKTGQITDNFYMTGFANFPIYLLKGEVPILFEGGISCLADVYIKDLQNLLAGQEPKIIFLSHVHWDHCGAVSALKKAFPSMKIAASEASAGILTKKTAIETITRLNKEGKDTLLETTNLDAASLTDAPFEVFTIDLFMRDGDRIDIGDGTIVQVIATPGHTRDHTSYFLPEQKILLAGEACGCLESERGDVIVEFVSGYEPYVDSLRKIADLSSEILCEGHSLVFSGREDVKKFLKHSLTNTLGFKDRIYALLDEKQGDIDAVMMQAKKEFYDWQPPPKQQEGPYLINLRAQIQHLIAIKDN